MTPPRKFKVLIQAPVFSRSGYGQWADALVPALLEYPWFDAEIEAVNFGACVPRQSKGPFNQLMVSKFAQPGQKTYDGCVSINLPCNSIPAGNIFNFNFCAGIETDRLPDYLMAGGTVNGRRVPGVNHWSLNVLMSTFARDVYFNSNIKPKWPVEVLNACADTSIFKLEPPKQASVDAALAQIAEEEIFLYVGQRTHPHYGLDRKNQDLLVEVFCETFKDKPNRPALVMKTNGTNFSCYDRDASLINIQCCKARVKDHGCNVYLLHGELEDAEMAALFAHPRVIASVTATRGEGYSLSHLQASLCGLPVIAPDHSGYKDFLDARSILLPGQLVEIPEAAVSEWFVKGSKWFEVERWALSNALRDLYFADRSDWKARARSLAQDNAHRFSLAAQKKRLFALLDKHLVGP